MDKSVRVMCLVAVGLLATRAVAHAGPVADSRPTAKTVVSSKVAKRLQSAREAITFARRAIPKQGNMRGVIRATQGNSAIRQIWTRSMSHQFEFGTTAVAAAVACGRGGNCSEYAETAKHYLEIKNVEPEFYTAKVDGEDHMFLWIGPKDAPDDEVVIADPWVGKPEPVRWKDFWGYHRWRQEIVFVTPKTGGPEQRVARRLLSKTIAEAPSKQAQRRLTLKHETLSSEDIEHYESYAWDQEFASTTKHEYVVAPNTAAPEQP